MYYEKEVNTRNSLMTRNSGLQYDPATRALSTEHPLTVVSLLFRSMRLVKQTYSAYVDGPTNARKWHLSTCLIAGYPPLNSYRASVSDAYYTQESVDGFLTIDDYVRLRSLQVPPGRYSCARAGGQRKTAKNPNRPSPTREDAPGVQLTPTSYTATTPMTPGTPCLTVSPRFEGVVLSVQLAPLEYLENIPPSTRDPSDERLLRSFRREHPS